MGPKALLTGPEGVEWNTCNAPLWPLGSDGGGGGDAHFFVICFWPAVLILIFDSWPRTPPPPTVAWPGVLPPPVHVPVLPAPGYTELQGRRVHGRLPLPPHPRRSALPHVKGVLPGFVFFPVGKLFFFWVPDLDPTGPPTVGGGPVGSKSGTRGGGWVGLP